MVKFFIFPTFARKMLLKMKKKGLLLVCMMLVSLISDAQISLPDSLLSVEKAYTYFFISPDTAKSILETVREQKQALL